MSAEPQELAELRRRAGEIADLNGIGGLLLWDQNTVMPPGGADARADQFEALERILHDRITDPGLGKLLDALEPWLASADPDSDDASLHRALRRDQHKAVNVPTELAGEISSASAHAQQAWMAAREAKDFKVFQPALEHVLELQARYIACFDGTGEFAHPVRRPARRLRAGPDDRGAAAAVRDACRTSSSRSSRAAAAAGEDGRVFPGHFPAADQQALATELLAAVGYDPEHWRLDPAVHPFARSMAHSDVRITTRWEEDDLAMAVYSCLHEFGHGLYEAQMDPRHYRTTLAEATGLGVHESQSAAVGEPRRALAAVLRVVPAAAAQAPRRAVRGAARSPDLYRNVNQVRLCLIRIEADETTYNLHIALRFELELALVEGRLSVADLPDAWNEATHRLLGLETPSLMEGVLQDIHWGAGMIGYFPTYTIGNLMAAQLWRALVDRPARHRRAASRPATSARCASGCATTSTATAASTPRASCCGGRRGRSCRSSRSSSTSKASCWTPGC